MPTAADVPFGIGYAGYDTWLAWSKEVAARGGLATSMPEQAGKYAGVPAARYPGTLIAAKKMGEPFVWTTGKQFGYFFAPRKVLILDTIHQMAVKTAIAEGKVAETAENIAKGFLFSSVGIAAVVAFLLFRRRK
jgi:hypothetical protein